MDIKVSWAHHFFFQLAHPNFKWLIKILILHANEWDIGHWPIFMAHSYSGPEISNIRWYDIGLTGEGYNVEDPWSCDPNKSCSEQNLEITTEYSTFILKKPECTKHQ